MLKSKKKEHDWDKNRARGTVYSRGVNTPTLGSLFKMDVLYYWYDRTYSEKP